MLRSMTGPSDQPGPLRTAAFERRRGEPQGDGWQSGRENGIARTISVVWHLLQGYEEGYTWYGVGFRGSVRELMPVALW